MVIPTWAGELISRQVDAYLAGGDSSEDPDLARVAAVLRAWPVYGDLGGVLLLATDGTVYCRDHATMQVRLEPDPGWRLFTWVAAAEPVPELRSLLPARPMGEPDCPACGGRGRVEVSPLSRLWCGACSGLGWGRRGDAALRP